MNPAGEHPEQRAGAASFKKIHSYFSEKKDFFQVLSF